MTHHDKAPERIWAWNDETPTEKDKSWSACDAGTGSVEYVRADLVTALAERVGVLEADKARLDFLDECNSALNARSGTVYGWALVMNHNINRLMTERHHLAVDLHDSKAHGAPSCRDAIDAEMRRIAAARAALSSTGEASHD